MNKLQLVITSLALATAITPSLAEANPELISNITANTGISSDGLDIHTDAIDIEDNLSQRSSFGVSYKTLNYDGVPGVGSAYERKFSLNGNTQFSNWLGLHGSIINDRITTSNTFKNLYLYDTWLSIRATSKLNVYLGAKQETFDNVVSLRKGIIGNVLSFSTEYALDKNDRISLGMNEEHYTDTNASNRNQIGFEHTVLKGLPHLTVGARMTDYSFHNQINNGYYAPPHYFSWEVPTHLYGNIKHGRIWYDVSATYGHQWAPWPTRNNQPSYDVGSSLAFVVSPRLTIKPHIDSWSSLRPSGGFARTTVGIDLQAKGI